MVGIDFYKISAQRKQPLLARSIKLITSVSFEDSTDSHDPFLELIELVTSMVICSSHLFQNYFGIHRLLSQNANSVSSLKGVDITAELCEF